jgi:hypothetical protein
MEMPQGNILYTYLKQRCLFFKNREQEGKTRKVPVGGRRIKGEGVGG